MTIPMGIINHSLLADYGRIEMSHILMLAMTYMATYMRDVQNSEIWYQFYLGPVTIDFKSKLLLPQEKFHLNSMSIGCCLFKKVIQHHSNCITRP